MIFRRKRWFSRSSAVKTTILLSVVFFFSTVAADDAAAQRRFSRTYPTGHAVRLTLTNRSGMVEVEGWDRAEINITANLDPPGANIVPQNLSGEIVINLLRDNPNRDVGSVNFKIRVPRHTLVNIETRIGNLRVSDIRSAFIRAHISTDGDIQLTNVSSGVVVAENGIGDIFYDGDMQEGGSYRFSSMQGTITLRIPFNSSFKLVATAPSSRNINLGQFASRDLSFVGDGRRVIGKFGTGSATLNATNQRGSIYFIRR